jgi:hypothetical protein
MPSRRCSEGQGDCDRDNDCASGLTCGNNNCRNFHPNAASHTDCCYDKPGIGASDDGSYCKPSRRCSEGQGDCDSDDDCASGLACGKDNCRDFHPNAATSMDCCIRKINLNRHLSGYANSWDGKMTFYAGSNRMITGFYSHHDNHREDRLWRMYTGTASGVKCNIQGWRGWANNWDGVLSFSCPDNQALYGVYSVHDNHREDRRFNFKCCSVGSFADMRYGGWTDYRNYWDSTLNYQCSKSNEVIVGVYSYHDNHREDRRWKFRCAELLKKY